VGQSKPVFSFIFAFLYSINTENLSSQRESSLEIETEKKRKEKRVFRKTSRNKNRALNILLVGIEDIWTTDNWYTDNSSWYLDIWHGVMSQIVHDNWEKISDPFQPAAHNQLRILKVLFSQLIASFLAPCGCEPSHPILISWTLSTSGKIVTRFTKINLYKLSRRHLLLNPNHDLCQADKADPSPPPRLQKGNILYLVLNNH